MQNAPVKVGDIFGDLTVTEARQGTARKGSTHWVCRCACGSEVEHTSSRLLLGSTKTCGKHRSARSLEASEERRQALLKYPSGFGAGTRLSRIWSNMLSRCRNPNFPKYSDYGARGITVDEAWGDYANFLAWALKSGYQDGLTIDRLDNWAGYGPSNCRWATQREQRHNRREAVATLEAFGEVKSVSDWALDHRCTVGYKTLLLRQRAGDPGEVALTAPRLRGRPPGGRAAWLSKQVAS